MTRKGLVAELEDALEAIRVGLAGSFDRYTSGRVYDARDDLTEIIAQTKRDMEAVRASLVLLRQDVWNDHGRLVRDDVVQHLRAMLGEGDC